MPDNRYIIIETRSHISRYKLKKDVGNMVRVRKGLYRTDNYIMVPSEDKSCEVVPYHLGETQPRGHGFLIPSSNTMAHIRLAQSNNKKTSILDGFSFSMKHLTTALIIIFAGIGLITGLV